MRSPSFLIILCTLMLASPARALEVHFKVNAGGKATGDWVSDEKFKTSGVPYGFKQKPELEELDDAAPVSVYKTARHQEPKFDFYNIENGRYLIRLHIFDGYFHKKRGMDILLEGRKIENNFNPARESIAKGTPAIIECIFDVSDGNGAQIEFHEDKGIDAFVSGIEIISTGEEVTGPFLIEKLSKQNLEDRPKSDHLDLEKFTGGHTRVVWQQLSNPNDYCGEESGTKIIGVDSRDGKGERVIFDQGANHCQPLLTPDAKQIVFSDRIVDKIYVIDFDGSNLREIGDGFATSIWDDPKDGVRYVFARSKKGRVEDPVVKMRLDGTGKEEIVWHRTGTGHGSTGWYELSPDGKFAAITFPWPKVGVLDVERGKTMHYNNGCWPNIAEDSSYDMFHFLGNHKEIVYYKLGGFEKRKIKVNTMPGVSSQKVYHPTWSNDTRFFTVTGPKRSALTEVFLGRFDEARTKVVGWYRLSHNMDGDAFGDAWIDPESRDSKFAKSYEFPEPKPIVSRGKVQDSLVYQWQNNRASNEIKDIIVGETRVCNMKLQGHTIYGRSYDLHFQGGSSVSTDQSELIAHAVRATNTFSMEAWVTPSSADQTGPARIISMESEDGKTNFMLGQKKNEFVFRVSTKDPEKPIEVKFGEIEAFKPYHVYVRIKNGRIRAHVNGKLALDVKDEPTYFSKWKGYPVLFGNTLAQNRDWWGHLEGVEIHAKELPQKSVIAAYEEFASSIESRDPAKTITIEAELVDISEVPTPADISPYKRCLIEADYEVKSIIDGNMDLEKIVVRHWAILDGTPIEATRTIGSIYELKVQPLEAHPQFDGERLIDRESLEELPIFIDVSSIPKDS